MDKIICVGKNYLKHAKELGDAIPEEPLFFLKPPSTICAVESGAPTVALPKHGEVHHEIELVLKIAGRGSDFSFSHFTFGLDLTIRDLQSRLKKAGQPWEKAKVFKNSAILGPWVKLSSLPEVMDLAFALKINGELRQQGVGRDMRWPPLELLKDAGRWFPLCDGDIMFTGTPEGVGPLKPGDRVEVHGGPVQYQLTCS
jgi:2-keto-4-pentenoate hydratase/2-oxohepta-3-ene-1,7-dioic acid hydratase in catechol pathway